MINAAGVFGLAYVAVGVAIAVTVKRRTDLETYAQPDWFVVALGWPLLVVIIALIVLLGVVLPLWDEIDFWSLLRRS
jgi:hypothetical protein